MSTATKHIKNPVFYRELPSIAKEEGTLEVFCVDVPEGLLDPTHRSSQLPKNGEWWKEEECVFTEAGVRRFATEEGAVKFIKALHSTSSSVKFRASSRLVRSRIFTTMNPPLAKFLVDRFSHREVIRMVENFSDSEMEGYLDSFRKYCRKVSGILGKPSFSEYRFLDYMESSFSLRIDQAMYNVLLAHLVRDEEVLSLSACLQHVVESGVMDAILAEVKALALSQSHKSKTDVALQDVDTFAYTKWRERSVELISLSAKQKRTLNTLLPRRTPLTKAKLLSRGFEDTQWWVVGNENFLSKSEAEDHLQTMKDIYHRRTLYAVQSLGYFRVINIKHSPVLKFLVENYSAEDISRLVEGKARELKNEAMDLHSSILKKDHNRRLPNRNGKEAALSRHFVRQRIADAMYNVIVSNLDEDDMDANGDPLFLLPLEIALEMADIDSIVEEIEALIPIPDKYLLHQQPRTGIVFYRHNDETDKDTLRSLAVPSALGK